VKLVRSSGCSSSLAYQPTEVRILIPVSGQTSGIWTI
jgi:hypothetical protein